MGIDRIGKGGAPPPTGTPDASAPTRPFEAPAVPREVSPAAPIEGTAPVHEPSALEELKAGRIDVETYLDRKVNEATAHLQGLDPAELASLREALRDRLETDPHMVDLVRRATGRAPAPPVDD